MADQDAGAMQKKTGASASEAATNSPKRNPVFKMMGLPNIRMKPPSRNWLIFLTLVGSWTAAVVYDRREKKKIQRKWAGLVSHLASEPLPTSILPRKLTVYVEAPPGDGLMSARDHFHEYIKPVLVAAALDWDAVEGRREGDIRAGLAERIRKLRKLRGERSLSPVEEDVETAVLASRVRSGIKPADSVAGDIIIGRHTWKEYIRGLHEGWLGPLDPPAVKESPTLETPSFSNLAESTQPKTDDASLTASADAPVSTDEKKPEEPEKSKKKSQPPPFNLTTDYPISILSPAIPHELPPSAVIQFPHILGFLNTPTRIYRFLNRRKIADDVGRQTAAAVFALYRPYHSATEQPLEATSSDGYDPAKSEQELLLWHEERDWHKSVRDRTKDEGRERTWLEDIVLDPRIATRMRRFELSPDQEAKADEIAAHADPWWKEMWEALIGPNDKTADI